MLNVCSKVHSAFSTTYPIYLYEKKTEEVPDVPEGTEETSEETTETPEEEETKPERELDDDDEAVVEDVKEEEEKVTPPVPTKSVTTEAWLHLNDISPLWQR